MFEESKVWFLRNTRLENSLLANTWLRKVSQTEGRETCLLWVRVHACVRLRSYLAQRTQLMCWLREKRNFCLCTVHTLMVLSSDAVTSDCPSAEKLTLRTVPMWARNDVDSAFLHKPHKTYYNPPSVITTFYTSMHRQPLWSMRCCTLCWLSRTEKCCYGKSALYTELFGQAGLSVSID